MTLFLVKLGDYRLPLANPPVDRGVKRCALARQSRVNKISPEFSQTNRSALRNPLHGVRDNIAGINGITRENATWSE